MVSTNGNRDPTNYEQKFADFIRMLAETQEDVVLVHHPEVLGDTFDEIVESLNRLADAKKSLVVVPQAERNPPGPLPSREELGL